MRCARSRSRCCASRRASRSATKPRCSSTSARACACSAGCRRCAARCARRSRRSAMRRACPPRRPGAARGCSRVCRPVHASGAASRARPRLSVCSTGCPVCYCPMRVRMQAGSTASVAARSPICAACRARGCNAVAVPRCWPRSIVRMATRSSRLRGWRCRPCSTCGSNCRSGSNTRKPCCSWRGGSSCSCVAGWPRGTCRWPR